MTLMIRVATLDDLPSLLNLHAEMDGEAAIALEQGQKIFQQMSSIPDYHSYLAFREPDPEAVGTFSLLFLPTLMHRGIHKFALLDAVAVKATHRSQGIGKAMMESALKLSAEAGCYKLMLSSNLKRDRAHAFYESLGYKQHGWSFSLKV
ncbi:MAG: GNAT family N-acetyltransferase [Leptolyngbyaceae bacterium]|nr:GNAT family N-acetyltransferase [Leptolyngbyaceae bacterium]